MRIISGEFKRRKLYSVPGNTARPTTDYTKESLFNIIDSCRDMRFLDLYSGSGSVGLEAVSRGAECCVFVEFSIKSIKTIKKNIELTGCGERCQIHRRKVIPYLSKVEESFDLVFMDPPYQKGLVKLTLQALTESQAVKKETIIIIEHSARELIPQEWSKNIIKSCSTKNTKLTFLNNFVHQEFA